MLLLPGSSENNASRKIREEESRKRQKEPGRGSRSAAHLREEEAARERRCSRDPAPSETPHICFRKHHSVFRKHGSLCLQTHNSFIIKGLLLTQNLNSSSYCKLLLPDLVSPQRMPTSPTLSLRRRERAKDAAGLHLLFQIAA